HHEEHHIDGFSQVIQLYVAAVESTEQQPYHSGSIFILTQNPIHLLECHSPSFLEFNDTLYVFFSDDSGVLYAVDTDGNTLDGWPIDVGQVISKSVVFSDLDCDGEAEVIAVAELADVLAYNLDGSAHEGFPMENEFVFTAAPMVMDMDGDGDLEILAGSLNSLVALDIKTVGSNSSYWNMYRGNAHRNGYIDILSLGGDISECSELSNNQSQYLPGGYELNPLFPNPFNPTTTISYFISRSGSIMIRAYDIRGRLVDNIISTFQSSGHHSIVWDASRYPSGIYFIIMETGAFRKTRKVLLIK
ncbi:MAG TPA: T9SS type A sorting domain-containing protein, partial [Candidatus Marinimicrobia bacterium]|nr:T9SS type A sorting domain-containing protein [Candidatus Neomarinimicrobiota bacterium]